MSIIDQWEAEYKKYVRQVRLTEPKWEGIESRMLTLIDLVRKKDAAIQYALGPTRDVKVWKLKEALALTEKLK